MESTISEKATPHIVLQKKNPSRHSNTTKLIERFDINLLQTGGVVTTFKFQGEGGLKGGLNRKPSMRGVWIFNEMIHF